MGYASDLADILAVTNSAKEAGKTGKNSDLNQSINSQFSSIRNSEAGQRAEAAINRDTNALNAGLLGRGSTGSIDLFSFLKDQVSGLHDKPDSPGFSGLYNGSSSTAVSAADTSQQDYLDMLHAEQERIWQREDTAHQREVADLKAAGLNPVLSATQGVSSGGSSSSDAQVVGAVSDLAAMAISGLTETAKGIGSLAAINSDDSSFLGKLGKWYKANARTVSTAVSTAKGLVGLAKMFI